MHAERDTRARSRNHCCRRKTISVTYCVSVALVIQHIMRMRRIILSSVGSACTILPHIIPQKARFSENTWCT